MIICYFYIFGFVAFPVKNDPPLVVDSNAVEVRQATFELFQAVSGWNSKVIYVGCVVYHSEFSARHLLDFDRQNF